MTKESSTEHIKEDKTQYQKGDIGEGGIEINEIIGSAPNFIVFFHNNDGLRWEVDDNNTPGHFSFCIEQFDKYQSMIQNLLWFKRKPLLESLGRALYSSIISTTKEDAKESFFAISKRIENEIKLHAKIHYVTASFILTIFICLTFSILYHFDQIGDLLPYWIGACAGGVGACVSVLFRINEIEIPLFTSALQHAFQGLSRILLGCLSGLIIIILIQANIVLGIAMDNLPSAAAFGIVSGFSERYLPSMLNSIQENTKINQNDT
jgi:hypothetical protein